MNGTVDPQWHKGYSDSVNERGTRDHERIKSWFRSNVAGLFGVLSVFGRRIKEMIQLQLDQAWTCNVTRIPPSAPHPFSFLMLLS
jgi:hypothetical protein